MDNIKEHMINRENIEDEEKIQEMRWKILNFGDQLRSGNEATKEMYDQIAGLHDKYMAEIEAKGISNGVMDVTWTFIQQKYQAHIQENDFIG